MNIKFRPNDLKSKELLKSIIGREIEELSKLDDEAKEKKNSDVRDLVKYYFELNRSTEEKCLRFSNFSLQFFILCFAGVCVVFLSGDAFSIVFSTILISVFAIQILFALIIVTAHETGVKLKDSFYEIDSDAVPLKKKLAIKNPLLYVFSAFLNMLRSSKAAPAYYMDGISSFVRNYHEDDIDQKIINNTEQLYLFQAENAHCSRLYFRMRRLRFWSLVASIIAAVVIGALFLFVRGQIPEWLSSATGMF